MGEPTTPERAFCEAAETYLLTFDGVTRQVLDAYLEPEGLRVEKISDIYWQLLLSAQNANMKSAVISGSMDNGLMALSDVLFGFEPTRVVAHYGDDSEAVLNDIVQRAKPRGQIRRSPRSIWPRYCRSITTGAKFLAQFPDAKAFYHWTDTFGTDARTRAQLPGVIHGQVFGLGFALACDFLKERGALDLGKPDVHIRKILVGLGRMTDSASDPEALETLITFADRAGYSPYRLDKLMWLVGSGWFYRHEDSIGRLPTRRDEFVASQKHLFAAVA